MKKLGLSLFIFALLTGCGPAVLPPPPTATLAPSRTPRPVQTAILTVTPYPPLQTDGPYLLFSGDKNNIIIMDANGMGRRYIQIPKDGYIYNLAEAVSPDGKWLAYFTGTSDEEPYNLAINLLNLSDGSAQKITYLVSPGFPKNLEPITETIYFTEYDSDCLNNPECQLRVVRSTFRDGIHKFDWSPDSQELAFAAQIDGPSSDVYIHNLKDKSIRRLTDEIENVGLMINWAPNGKKILYESTTPAVIYPGYYLHVADPNFKSPQNPKIIDGGPFWIREGWINDNSYLISNGGEGAPPHHLRYINTDTQQVKLVWEYIAGSLFIDREKERIVLFTYPEGWASLQPEPERGLYLVTFDGNYKIIVNKEYVPLQGTSPSDTYFAINISSYTDEIFPLVSVGIDGTTTQLSRKVNSSSPPATSPDGKWVIITDDKGTYLYSDSLQLIKSWNVFYTKIVWIPDSTGTFLSSYPNLYYLSLNDKELRLTNICPSQDCLIGDYVWLP